MRKPLIVLAVLAVIGGAAPALAAPPVPTVPKNCHEWNALLHIDNVRSCDGDPTE